jgi:hypothetical protein
LTVTWLVTATAGLLLRDAAMRYSGAGAVQSALTAALLLWPLTVGLAAVTTARPLRPGLRDLVQATPDVARVRLVLGPLVGLTGWALVGLAASVLVCTVVAGAGGSWAVWSVYLAVLPIAAGTVAAAAAGGTLGVLVPSWVTPPVVAVATYLGYLLPLDATQTMTAYANAQGDAAMVPDPSAVVRVTAAHLLLAGGAAALGLARLTASRRVGVLAVGVGVVWVVILALSGTGQVWYRPLPETSWTCTPVAGSDRELCLPGEQIRDLTAAANALAGVDRRVAESFAGAPLRYGPVSDGSVTLPVPVPYGDLGTYPEVAAQSVARYVVECAARADDPGADGLDEQGFTRFYGYLGYLQGTDVALVGGERIPALSTAEAQALVARAGQGCRGG